MGLMRKRLHVYAIGPTGLIRKRLRHRIAIGREVHGGQRSLTYAPSLGLRCAQSQMNSGFNRT